jgi:hypothetical protein
VTCRLLTTLPRVVREGRAVPDVDIYPVGLLADLKRARRDWWVWGRRYAVRMLWRNVRGSWRRRSYWNGYLAEVDLPGVTRCGHGWTKARARLDLARHVAEVERG